MSSDNVRKIVEDRIKDQWGVTTPVAWDNVKYTPVRGKPFIRCLLDEVDSDTISMSCIRTYFLLTIQVFTKSDDGTSNNLAFCDTLRNMFINQDIGFVDTTYLTGKKGMVQRIGNEEEWHQRNVIVNMYSDFNY